MLQTTALHALKGKVILITGASTGLGKELSCQLFQKGVNLILVARNLSALKKLKKKLTDGFQHKEANQTDVPEIVCIQCDVSNKQQCSNAISQTFKKFGRLDYLIANAGVTMWQRFTDIEDPDDLKEVMNINYMGNVYLTHYLLQAHKKFSSTTKMVFISSLQSFLGIPYHSGYSASKHALDGFIKVIRSEEPSLPILNVLMAWVRGTELRKNAFGSELSESKKNEITLTPEKNNFQKLSISRIINQLLIINVKDCARLIIETIPTQQSKIFLPPIAFLVPIFNFFLPNWVGKKIKKITTKEKKIGTKVV